MEKAAKQNTDGSVTPEEALVYRLRQHSQRSASVGTPNRSALRYVPTFVRLGLFSLLLGLLVSACSLEGNGTATDTPEIANFEVSPLGVTAGQQTTFLWDVTYPSGTTCTLDVDGDGAPDYTPLCESGNQRHTYGRPGRYEATLELRVNTQRTRKTIMTDVRAAGAPQTDVTTLSWRLSKPQPYRVAEAEGIALGGKLYSFSGFDSTKGCCTPTDRAYVFDPQAETWTPLAPMPAMNGTAFGGVTHAGIATDGNDVFIAGGYTSSVTGRGQIFGTREVLRYDPVRNAYSRLPDLPVERAAGQLEYYGGKLYYFGGTNQARTEDVGNLYVLDLLRGATSWREGAPLPNPRNHLGGVVLGGKIYALAGQRAHDSRLTTLNDVHAYNPKTDIWRQVADLPLPLSHIADSSFVLGGRLIVVGGEVDHLKAVANVFSYDPQSNAWSELTPLPIARMSTVADTIGGVMISAGGSGKNGGSDTYIGTPTNIE